MGGPRPGGQLSVQVAGAGSVVVSRKSLKSSLVCLLAALSLISGTGCDEPPTSTTPSNNPGVTIESFSGTLVKGGSAFYSFVVPVEGSVSLTLLTLTIAGQPSTQAVTMGIGIPGGTTCRANAMVSVTAGPTPQVSNSNLLPAIYCAIVSDPNSELTADAAFSININRPISR
jgi:hypothetical protein